MLTSVFNSKKRQKNDKKSYHVPIMVLRMSSIPFGRLKRYQPLDTRYFVPFKGFTVLSIEKIKLASEGFYRTLSSNFDVLASNRGISYTKIEQVRWRNIFFILLIDVITGQ